MRNTIRYVPDGIELRLDEDDLGHPDGLDILQHHYWQSTRRELGFNGANPAFVCLTHEGGRHQPRLVPQEDRRPVVGNPLRKGCL
jgi:hypothetical protein